MSNSEVDNSKRNWIAVSCTVGAAGGLAAVTPFVGSFEPSERAKAAGAAVEVDISDLKVGEQRTVEWRGKPVWVIRRSPEQLDALRKNEGQLADAASDRKAYPTPEYAKNSVRARKEREDVLVAVGICSHLGCSPGSKFTSGAQPSLPDDWKGGFLCACHGSTFDMAGRVFKNKPAPDNLEIPPHMYLADGRLLIGEDKKPG
jgi:ubiquinol-cytochrome c reductase iron-sulfur subunit